MSKTFILFPVFLILLIFTRFYNIELTARFTEDESLDLVRIHQIYVDRELTFVGPRNDQGTKVFSSLTHYLLLPATIIGDFDPVSPTYGAAFWGVITGLLIYFLAHKINTKLTPFIGVLTIVWLPLLETSRWAWNPNLIPLWSTLALICFTLKTKLGYFLMGVFLALTIHQHYYAVFVLLFFLPVVAIETLKSGKVANLALFASGGFIFLIPFYVFDLLHPPGLFLTGLMSQSNQTQQMFDVLLFLQKSQTSLISLINYYTQYPALSFSLAILMIILLVLDLRSRSYPLVFFGVWIGQILGVALIPQFFEHYLIPVLVVFLLWIIYPRLGLGLLTAKLILVILILGGILSLNTYLITPNYKPTLSVFRSVTKQIVDQVKNQGLGSANIAVLASSDRNTEGKRYRDLLLIQDVVLNSKHEYFNSDYLFVVSTSTEEVIRSDPAAEMHLFRSGKLVDTWDFEDPEWRLYLFAKAG